VRWVDRLETAADKLSALAWHRVRQRGSARDDPTIIRNFKTNSDTSRRAGTVLFVPKLRNPEFSARRIEGADRARRGVG
jgi:hypothetical protein